VLVGGAAAASVAASVLAAGAPALAASTADDAGLIVRWNQELLRILRTPGQQPATVHATRTFAMVHLAIHEAVAHSSRFHGEQPAAAAQAAHDVLAALFPAQVAALDAHLAADLATVTDPRSRATGIHIGHQAASRVLAQRVGDGSSVTPPAIPPGTEPGQYRPDPPAFAPATFTHWANVKPFVLHRADQFRVRPYPSLHGGLYAAAIDEVRRLGQNTSTERTADQTVQARFWPAPIWNYWNEITQTVITAERPSLATAARVFARLNVTFADAAIAFYDSKYHFLIWRPVSAIRFAEVGADPTWLPLLGTPSDPSYPGAHSVISAAGRVVLESVFGPRHHFTVTSEVLPGVTRSFRTFAAAVEDAGTSRMLAGVHTSLDHVAGVRMGEAVARFVMRR
jgi:membrane-associated phospholipid phosphatase